jgi:polyisoprenoid-binding protein YceI
MKSIAVFALAGLLAPAALAQHQTFVVNPDASEVKITLKTTHEVVNGTFQVQSGSIEFDRSNPKMAGLVARPRRQRQDRQRQPR